MKRIRIHYAKTEGLRYTSNLDMQKVWERALRRAGLPLYYSQGFHPQPRIQQACPLPLGLLSQCEIVDVWLEDDTCTLEGTLKALQPALPTGIELLKLEEIDPAAPALQKLAGSADYDITLLDPFPVDELERRTAALLGAETLIRERRGKNYDLRPLVEDLAVVPGEPLRLSARLLVRDGATGRPDELLAALGLDPFGARIVRVRLILAEA